MKLLVLVSLAAFVSGGWSAPNTFNPVLGYMTRFGIPEADRIQKAEETYLENQSSRIIGGNPAGTGHFPFQAGIITDIVNQQGRGLCGGTLVRNTKVITAAHCWFDGINLAWRFTVVLGSNLLFTGGVRVLTNNVVTHPSWQPWLVRNDIAVVTIQSVSFTGLIEPILLPSGNQLLDDFSGSQATTSGFGLTSEDGTISQDQFLSYVRVNVIRNEVCNVAFPTIIQPGHICTSTLHGGGPNRGDSGGPLITERGGRIILIGVTSFGSALAPIGLPSVYARVTAFTDFINANL